MGEGVGNLRRLEGGEIGGCQLLQVVFRDSKKVHWGVNGVIVSHVLGIWKEAKTLMV